MLLFNFGCFFCVKVGPEHFICFRSWILFLVQWISLDIFLICSWQGVTACFSHEWSNWIIFLLDTQWGSEDKIRQAPLDNSVLDSRLRISPASSKHCTCCCCGCVGVWVCELHIFARAAAAVVLSHACTPTHPCTHVPTQPRATHPRTHTPTHPHTHTPMHPHTHTPTHPQQQQVQCFEAVRLILRWLSSTLLSSVACLPYLFEYPAKISFGLTVHGWNVL